MSIQWNKLGEHQRLLFKYKTYTPEISLHYAARIELSGDLKKGTSALRIKEVLKEDEGYYYCTVTYSSKKSTYDVRSRPVSLTVQGKMIRL